MNDLILSISPLPDTQGYELTLRVNINSENLQSRVRISGSQLKESYLAGHGELFKNVVSVALSQLSVNLTEFQYNILSKEILGILQFVKL